VTSLIESVNISPSPYVNAALSVLVFIIIAKAASIFIDKVARRIARITRTGFDDRIIDVVHRPVFWTIFLVGMVHVVTYLALGEKASFYITGSLYSAVVLIWTITVNRIASIIYESLIGRRADVTGLGRDVLPLIDNISRVVIFVVSITVIFSIWQINLSPVLTSAGIIGAGVAIAAKDTIANLLGGFSIFFDKPFKVGDYIVLDGGERGEVVSVGLRSTRIETRDYIQIAVPNSIIANSKIVNESAPVKNFRVRVPVTVAYGSDIDVVEKTLVDIAGSNENVIAEPTPRVRFRKFGESALNFELLCWAKEPALRGLTIHELNSTIYRKFSETGIRIPFPQRDIHILEGRKDR
jgi:small-conductance mechanosensitive channel